MIIVCTCLVAIVVIAFVLGVRPKDLPAAEPESPFRHLDDRKAAIYENLRDLQFEYRVGKLSDEDYQATKRDLQKELAAVLAEVDRVRATLGQGIGMPVQQAARPPAPPKPAAQPKPLPGYRCPHCGARFERSLKFCGECGKPMKEATA